jgi:hypothetical protein
MERIIEFPQRNYQIYGSELQPKISKQGYCFCYQHDVNESGYGPYGFRTATAKTILDEVFEPVSLWDDSRKVLIDAEIQDIGGGLLFLKDQPYLIQLEQELSQYRQAVTLYTLRKRYGKASAGEFPPEEHFLYSAYRKGAIQPAVISRLLEENCTFFYGYSDMNLVGTVFIFFDPIFREKMKSSAEHLNIHYWLAKSFNELASW